MKVVVAMSGGLDSSVAALTMVREGHEVEGVFMRLWDPLAGHGSRCCSLEDMEDARRVARHLGIPLREACLSRQFFDEIFIASLEAYARGLTPNPCVECNEKIKFAELERMARELGADRLVTGHYARVERGADDRWHLFRGSDRAKDQSYFLHRLGQERLARVVFPLGETTKDEARSVAREAGLPVADKPESQELCFVPPGGSYAQLLESWLPGRTRSGSIVDRAGRRLGEHRGVHRFTVGQRRGLGIAAPRPLYVLGIEPETGNVVVGTRDELLVSSFRVREPAWVAGRPPAAELQCTVRIRSRHPGVRARVRPEDGYLVVETAEPVRAPAPGQAAVFYAGEEVLGGGWIVRPSA